MWCVFASHEDVDAQSGIASQHLLEFDKFCIKPKKILRATDNPNEVDGGLWNDELTQRLDDDGKCECDTSATSHSKNIVSSVLRPAWAVRSGHDDRDIGLTSEGSKVHSLALASS